MRAAKGVMESSATAQHADGLKPAVQKHPSHPTANRGLRGPHGVLYWLH
jgi:hypothetical protein